MKQPVTDDQILELEKQVQYRKLKAQEAHAKAQEAEHLALEAESLVRKAVAERKQAEDEDATQQTRQKMQKREALIALEIEVEQARKKDEILTFKLKGKEHAAKLADLESTPIYPQPPENAHSYWTDQ